MSSIFQLPEPIKSKLYISHSSINKSSPSPKSSKSHHHEKIILEHPFNHKIEIFIPNFNDFNDKSKEIKELFLGKLKEKWFYYKVDDLKLSYFLEKNFVDNYLKKGINYCSLDLIY